MYIIFTFLLLCTIFYCKNYLNFISIATFIKYIIFSVYNIFFSPVAFYAYISKDFGGVGLHHVFLYDTIETNQGNGYSKHTGTFTAPSTGIYAFCYTAFAAGEHVAGETGMEKLLSNFVITEPTRVLFMLTRKPPVMKKCQLDLPSSCCKPEMLY